ncbi:methyltransferase-like protein [Plakobranchus ocellatus]|uniref:U6 snRNA m(6)A methyltransferase n=1 Tax=Plakobranchus ocellatus TaxID=259542 RepID=A0AAV4DAK8_9GAST|nr:methyltransferase-like protein [Plakobranchus ocellatus]
MTTQDDNGKVFLDFKNADALRALTRCLLKEDFGLTVELPMNRLVPTLPLRLNYIHWLEDIIGPDAGKWGIDIGTGASCVYPLLASKMNQWNFLATETDAENFYHAQKNVKNNGFSHVIQVKKVSGESILTSSLESFSGTEKFDFSMCNPPFFADHMEAQGLSTTRTDDRPEAGSVSTASPQECIVAGGEIAFVRQMIEESTVLRGKIRQGFKD